MSTERKPDAATGPLYPYRKPRLSLTEPLRLIVLGATGSIGVQTLDLVRRHPARLQVAAVSCRDRVDELAAALAELAAFVGHPRSHAHVARGGIDLRVHGLHFPGPFAAWERVALHAYRLPRTHLGQVLLR